MSCLKIALTTAGLMLMASPCMAFTLTPVTTTSAGVHFTDPHAALSDRASQYQDDIEQNDLRAREGDEAFASGTSLSRPLVSTTHFGPVTTTSQFVDGRTYSGVAQGNPSSDQTPFYVGSSR